MLGPNHPPYFMDCPYSLTTTTPPRRTKAKVYWSTPWAYDYEDGFLRLFIYLSFCIYCLNERIIYQHYKYIQVIDNEMPFLL